MNNIKAIHQTIPLDDLILWDNNARFPDKYLNTDPKELIRYFLSKTEFKMTELIEEIIKDIDLPQLEKLVVWDDNNKFVVIEGNRRLAAYKLLAEPELTDDAKLRLRLLELKTTHNITGEYLLEGVVAKDVKHALRYVDRKHVNGNNEVNWQEPERANYNVRRGNANYAELLKTAISAVVRELDLPEEMKDSILGKGYVTTFYRIITSNEAKTEFGFNIDPNGNLTIKEPNFKQKLKVIILNVLSKQDFSGKKVDSRSLNKGDAKEAYIKSITPQDIAQVDIEIKKNTKEDIFGEKKITVTTAKAQIILPKSSSRNRLIPQSCRLTINETKINNVYRELREDLLIDDSTKAVPNATGVMFRVFLDMSITFFLESHGINLPVKTAFTEKITKCSDLLESNNIATKNQLINIRKVATDKGSLLAIENFHDYTHSHKVQPSPSDLKIKWDNLEEFFQLLWDYLAKKKVKVK